MKQALPIRLPLIDGDEKASARTGGKQNAGLTAPDGWEKEGVPYFWKESKSEKFWSELLAGLCITDIFDLTASSQLLKAAVKTNISYNGLTCAGAHARWLTALSDRAMMKVMADEETEVAGTIHDLFAHDLFSSDEEEGDHEDEQEDGDNDNDENEEQAGAEQDEE